MSSTARSESAFGDGLFTTQDAEWQRPKRYLQLLFVARRVNAYATAMTEQVQQVVQRWRARPPGTVDLHEEMTRLTLATVCRILFGEDLGQALPVVQRTFGPMGDAVLRRALAGGRVSRGWPTPVNQRLRRAQRELRASATRSSRTAEPAATGRRISWAVARHAGPGKIADRR
jgi:cytochrome P450